MCLRDVQRVSYTRMKFVRSGLIFELASESGSTPLQYAVCRGDLEIVELLLEHGANSCVFFLKFVMLSLL